MNQFVKYWVPVYLIGFAIFYFSSLSNPPEPFILKTPDYIKHFSEYALFSFFVLRAFKNTDIFKKDFSLFTLAFIILFGISDEIFQAFTPGRFSSLFDIGVDTFASLFLISIKSLIF